MGGAMPQPETDGQGRPMGRRTAPTARQPAETGSRARPAARSTPGPAVAPEGKPAAGPAAGSAARSGARPVASARTRRAGHLGAAQAEAERLSVADRVALGKAARAAVPRSS